MHVAAVLRIEDHLLPARASPARHARGQGARVRGRGQDRPHAPAGRDAAHARPGDLGLGRRSSTARCARSATRCRRCTSSRSAAPPSAPGSTAHPRFAERVARELARADRPRVRHRAEQVRGARRPRRAVSAASGALKQLADGAASRSRTTCAGSRSGPRAGHRRDRASPRTSPAARSCRARSTRRSARR